MPKFKPGDWVWILPNQGFVPGGPYFVQIQDLDNVPCHACKDGHCVEWDTLLGEPNSTEYRQSFYHVSECCMSKEKPWIDTP